MTGFRLKLLIDAPHGFYMWPESIFDAILEKPIFKVKNVWLVEILIGSDLVAIIKKMRHTDVILFPP